MAQSMVEPTLLYIYVEPGLWTTGVAKKSRIHSLLGAGISSMPQPMHSTSRTVRFFRFSLGSAGDSSGKMSISRSSSFKSPSV